jgi:transposase
MELPASYCLSEMRRFSVVDQTLRAGLGSAAAARMLGLSRRQIFRLKARVRKLGPAGIRHGNCGRTPANARQPDLRQQVERIYRTDCFDFNFAHFTETLADEYAISLSRETVRRWLRAARLGRKPHSQYRHRRRRQRKTRFGMMLFLDGSPHHWLGPHLPVLTLILCTDDATGKPLGGGFYEQETLAGCFEVLGNVFKRWGLPQSLYLDRASQFTTTRHGGTHRFQRDDQPTHFETAMTRLGIELIFANSPQARGRGERINGSFQGRLVAELRRAGIKTAAAATDYLNHAFIPKYAERFGVKPREPVSAFRKPPPGRDLRTILCAHHTRNVDNDNTVSLHGIRYQLLPTHRTIRLAATDVDVQEWFDGTVHVFHPRAGEVAAQRLASRPPAGRQSQSRPCDRFPVQTV